MNLSNKQHHQLPQTRDLAVVLQNFIEHLMDQQLVQQKNTSHSNQLSTARLTIIQFLIEKGPTSLKRLVEFRKVSPATMSRLVTCLVNDGLVLRANSKKDRRSKIFVVTTRGRKQANDMTEEQLQSLMLSIAKLSSDQQIMLNKSITLIKNVISHT
ncbi:MAG: hypothetical protein COA74_12855 [Gammaproteobacteria bacterium]|nr:MAG: hypothetical protein COA74_12855 [Gammaproteobacteria bacterium]